MRWNNVNDVNAVDIFETVRYHIDYTDHFSKPKKKRTDKKHNTQNNYILSNIRDQTDLSFQIRSFCFPMLITRRFVPK